VVIAVVNTKGGTGKTTSAVFLAHGMAQDGKTLLIDADPQGSAMSWSQIVGEGFFPSTIPLAVADLHLRLPALAESFKHVVIDTPPGEGDKNENPITESAILAADAVLLPLSPSTMDIDRLAPTLDLISRVELRHKHTPQLHVLLTKVRAGTNSSVASRLVLKEDFNLPVLKVEIPLLERFANAMGLPITVLGEYKDVLAALGERVA
jgi:chromosome partitioning protein